MNYKIIAKIVKINKELNKIFKTDKIDKKGDVCWYHIFSTNSFEFLIQI